MKYKIGDEVKVVKGGYYYCSPEVWLSVYKDLVSENSAIGKGGYMCTICGVKENVSGYNWYQLRDYGNWYTEEALELVKKLPFKVGTLLNYNGIKMSFVGEEKYGLVAEVVYPNTGGWNRSDRTVPKDYQSRYTNLYYYVSANEPLWEPESDKTTGFKEPVPEIDLKAIRVSSDKFEANPCKDLATGIEPHYTEYFNRQIKVVYSKPNEELQKPVDINKKKKSKFLVHL